MLVLITIAAFALLFSLSDGLGLFAVDSDQNSVRQATPPPPPDSPPSDTTLPLPIRLPLRLTQHLLNAPASARLNTC